MESTSANDIKLRGEYLKNRNTYLAQKEPCVIHCHHYNTYLQAVIEDTHSYLDVYPVLQDASESVVFSQMSLFFKHNSHFSIEEKKKLASEYFKFSGFGILDFTDINENGGVMSTKSDHYGIGWKLKFNRRNKDQPGVSFFTAGYIAGAIEAIFSLPLGSLKCEQTKCIAKGDEVSEFKIDRINPKQINDSPKEGVYQTNELHNNENSDINYIAVREALIQMPIEGDSESGLIEAFGVFITRMYSNYYCLMSYNFLKLFEKQVGIENISIAQELLTEAGHVCAFNTFGGIMISAEWEGLIKPMIKDKNDWVHGIVAVVNGLGWGFWEVEELIPEKKLVVKITSGYEANSYIKSYGKSTFPISFLATGGVAGIMNLIYMTEISQHPVTLDNNLYKEIYTGKHFKSKQIKCRAMGDEYDLVEATLA